VNKAYKFRIYPNKAQIVLLEKSFGCARFVYNYYLNKKKELYNEGKTNLTYKECSKDLTQLKRQKEYLWLNEVDKDVCQKSLRNLDNAYKNFFNRIKKGIKPYGFPKFKKKSGKNSYTTSSTSVRFEGKYINLPKLKKVKCKGYNEIQGRILSATVSKSKSGKYFVSLSCELQENEYTRYHQTGKSIGIDLGIKDFAIFSDENQGTVQNPTFLKKYQKKIVREQRRLSRKIKGSKNRSKARIKLAKIHEKVANKRLDFQHKLSTKIVKEYDLISTESLKVKNMIKNHNLAKSISDAAWSEFARQLEYKSKWNDKIFVQIDTFFASSQICNVCGYKNEELKDLSIREWTCKCGVRHDRDKNASINILNEGLRILSK
jgi:putative transposase